ncbi:hypothetical protein NCAS_0A13370 [Naumovozyma castellii]|uniref:Uncharacterized protein n=1 Tax=Naumovozyma castellii TaxID=27288 RepID=G0V8U6_NAUCA|nr:hypothetical protein NCAS_0A13370 [Naumovozyma castellii CBS 4309]CCC67895.1 hypothetical protein NCAS_0A13370 [Naumovozyma castellii CBS 4309]
MTNQPEIQFQALEQQIISYTILAIKQLVVLTQSSLPILIKFSQTQPTLFFIIAIFLIIYFSWKVITNIITIVKRLIFGLMIVSVILISLRGLDQFFNYDLVYLFQLVKQGQRHGVVLIKWVDYLKEMMKLPETTPN